MIKKIQELESGLKEFERKPKEIKIKKFQRDNKDYSQGKVYIWMHEKKKVTWASLIEKYSDQESSDFDSSDLSGDEGPSTLNLRSRILQIRGDKGTSGRISFQARGHKGHQKH